MENLDKNVLAKSGRITRFFLAAAATLSIMTVAAQAQTLTVADPNKQGDGTLSVAAAWARSHGPLPASDADVAAKAAANRAHDEAVRSGALRPASPSELASAKAPAIVGGHNFAGQNSLCGTPTDSTGAIGTTRYIQTINCSAKIYNRTTHATIGSGTLNQLAGQASTVSSFDPQIIWDPTTNKFHYAMDSVFSATDNKLSIGFSKTASPANVTTDWCHYQISYGTPFPDYPKLGDSQFFTIYGVNVFNPGFVGSDILAWGKPSAASITTCPVPSTLPFGVKTNIKDSGGVTQTFTPVPSQQVDNNPTGYVVARNLGLPATKLWFYNVTKGGTGAPVFGNGRGVTVTTYTFPADATQPTFTQKLDTLDARNTQAVQAINPDRGTIQSFWTQHTIGSGTVSAVRWYEINPAPATPVVLRSGNLAATSTFFFNGSISPDRKKNGLVVAFGDSFVAQFSVSSSTIPAGIRAASSFNGGAVSVATVINGVGPYRDFSCVGAGSTCRWGDYSAATPDPAPTTVGRGEVWGTNQYSGLVSPPPTGLNERTRIFALQP